MRVGDKVRIKRGKDTQLAEDNIGMEGFILKEYDKVDPLIASQFPPGYGDWDWLVQYTDKLNNPNVLPFYEDELEQL